MDVFKEIEKEIEGLDFKSLNSFKSESQERIDAWLESRRGKFTASEFHRLMGYENKDVFPTGAETYVLDKVLEVLTVREEASYTNASMEWGTLNEKEAIERFMKITDLQVSNYGEDQKLLTLGKSVGCTPDGLIADHCGIEVKCPNSKTHLTYLNLTNQEDFKKLCKNYYWQIQGSMYVTGRSSWYFVSFDPRFKNENHHLKVLEIMRNDDDIQLLKNRLQEAIRRRDDKLKDYELPFFT